MVGALFCIHRLRCSLDSISSTTWIFPFQFQFNHEWSCTGLDSGTDERQTDKRAIEKHRNNNNDASSKNPLFEQRWPQTRRHRRRQEHHHGHCTSSYSSLESPCVLSYQVISTQMNSSKVDRSCGTVALRRNTRHRGNLNHRMHCDQSSPRHC